MRRKSLAYIFCAISTALSVAEDVRYNDRQRQIHEAFGANAHVDLPFAASCFSAINGVKGNADAASCAMVRANYTNRCEMTISFRLYPVCDMFTVTRLLTPGAYMDTQWETCQATGAGCLLNSIDPSNEVSNSTCSQGSVPIGHVRALVLVRSLIRKMTFCMID